MGAAAIVRGKKDAVREEDMKDDKSLAYIPLNKITDNIKVYQHCDNGQVMVLLYQTLEDVLQNKDIENWAECQGKKINFIILPTHLPTHSPTHSPTNSLTYSLTLIIQF